MASMLKIMPIGGLGEVGKNMMSIEYGRNIIIIDAGMMFPELDMLGVDYIIPDWGYLRDKEDRIRAVIVTHGHQDHIGALSHFLQQFNVPVYTTRLTRGLIEVKLRQDHMLEQTTLHTIAPGDVIEIGPFTIEPFHVCHSIPDTVGLGITTPAGLMVHSGDFKFDHTPVDGQPTDMAKLADFSRRGVMMLLSDSTNADKPGTTPSEAVLDDVFHQIMRQAPGRLIIATFASLISRIQQVVTVAARNNRKIAIAGKNMIDNARMARDLGYLNIPDEMYMTGDEMQAVAPEKVVIMATGSQGEPMGVLNRLATGQHPSLQVEEGDTVVLSSHTIPGNEEMVHGVINRLFQRGADVLYHPVVQVHVSGHASQEEQKLLISMLRPKFFVPVHGELRHLKLHGKLARELGIPDENVAEVENGYPIMIRDGRLEIGKRVPGGYVFVDGALVGETGPAVLREREALGQSGFVTAIVRLNKKTGKPAGIPRLLTRGFVFVPEAAELLGEAQHVVRTAAAAKPGAALDQVEHKIETALSDFLYKETHRKPVVTATVIAE